MSEDNHSHYRLDPSDRLNGLGQRRKRPKKVIEWTESHMVQECVRGVRELDVGEGGGGDAAWFPSSERAAAGGSGGGAGGEKSVFMIFSVFFLFWSGCFKASSLLVLTWFFFFISIFILTPGVKPPPSGVLSISADSTLFFFSLMDYSLISILLLFFSVSQCVVVVMNTSV